MTKPFAPSLSASLPKSSGAWLVDVSNTFTKIARCVEGRLGSVRRVPTAEWSAAKLREVFKQRSDRVLLASVVPRATALFRDYFPEIHSLDYRSPLGLGVDYPKPASIGADRLANAAGVVVHYGYPAVVVDFGTAVTFDVVDGRPAYIGGVIAPGLQALTGYLHERTALLPEISLREPKSAVGRSTAEAMRVGAVIGYRGLVRSVLTAVLEEVAPEGKIKVVFTGGDARLLANHLGMEVSVDPTLTLKGLAVVAERLWGGK
jgi:type III pantothenate kinase